jgi:fatty-acyl-CoA synthase
MKGYLNSPEATAGAFAGGWFHTGDLGYPSAAGDNDGLTHAIRRLETMYAVVF